MADGSFFGETLKGKVKSTMLLWRSGSLRQQVNIFLLSRVAPENLESQSDWQT